MIGSFISHKDYIKTCLLNLEDNFVISASLENPDNPGISQGTFELRMFFNGTKAIAVKRFSLKQIEDLCDFLTFAFGSDQKYELSHVVGELDVRVSSFTRDYTKLILNSDGDSAIVYLKIACTPEIKAAFSDFVNFCSLINTLASKEIMTPPF